MSNISQLPVFNMQRRLDKHSGRIQDAISKILKSGHIILGESVENFEREFANYIGVDHCIGVGNGTDAIEIALRSLGLVKGAKVGITANAGGYSRIAIEASGFQAVYEDVHEGSHCLSKEGVLKLIEAGVSAIILTHLYGRVAPDSSEIAALCKSANIWLIEDCAQAHGSQHSNKHAGTFGDLATFSFYPTKNLGTLGDAGCVVSNNEAIAARVRKLRTYGWQEKYDVSLIGGRNSRIDAIQAAILSSLLPYLDEENEERREIARIFSLEINSDKLSMVNKNVAGCNFHLLLVRTPFRAELIEHLISLRIGYAIHYPIPDHHQDAWDQITELRLPVTEKLASEILSVPCFPGMTSQELSYLISALNSFAP
jgi:dTDP-4-amino-4,6-dideoxygalactose transaminase